MLGRCEAMIPEMLGRGPEGGGRGHGLGASRSRPNELEMNISRIYKYIFSEAYDRWASQLLGPRLYINIYILHRYRYILITETPLN